jgi:quercetin dioxygenase-like cupin family protein
VQEEQFEIYETPDKSARFVFSYSDDKLTTGLLIMKPGSILAKHNRPLGFENLMQISGKCQTIVFEEDDPESIEKEVEMSPGDLVQMNKGQWHIHANPFKEESITFFKLVGDITEIMQKLRDDNIKVKLEIK